MSAWDLVWVFRGSVGAPNVLLGALIHSLWLCPSLCFSLVICSLAAPLFLLLTSSPNSDLMLTSDPHLKLLFFATNAFFFFFFFSWLLKTPPFLSVHSVTDTPHTDCVLSTHWEGGGDPHSLSLFLSVFITLFYIPLPLLLLFSVSHSFLSLLSHPFFPLLSCMSACEQDFAHCSSPSCLHGGPALRLDCWR